MQPYYFEHNYYNSLVQEFNDNFQFFYAVQGDDIVAISIIIFANNSMHYHLSASTMNGRKTAASNLMLFEAAKFGISKGFKTFHLGGGVGADEDDLFKFKKAFNRDESEDYYIGKRVFNQDIYTELVGLSNVRDEVNFFPRYRG